jgi:hypothetical protein
VAQKLREEIEAKQPSRLELRDKLLARKAQIWTTGFFEAIRIGDPAFGRT